jgi:hypothetical protein
MDAPAVQQMLIGCGENESLDQRCGGDKPIRRILVRKVDQPAVKRYFISQCRFDNESLRQCLADPDAGIGGDLNTAALKQHHSFPDADRREPKLIFRIFQSRSQPPFYALLFKQRPKPDLGVEKYVHERRTSQSDAAIGKFNITHNRGRAFHTTYQESLAPGSDGHQLSNGFAPLGNA